MVCSSACDRMWELILTEEDSLDEFSERASTTTSVSHQQHEDLPNWASNRQHVQSATLQRDSLSSRARRSSRLRKMSRSRAQTNLDVTVDHRRGREQRGYQMETRDVNHWRENDKVSSGAVFLVPVDRQASMYDSDAHHSYSSYSRGPDSPTSPSTPRIRRSSLQQVRSHDRISKSGSRDPTGPDSPPTSPNAARRRQSSLQQARSHDRGQSSLQQARSHDRIKKVGSRDPTGSYSPKFNSNASSDWDYPATNDYRITKTPSSSSPQHRHSTGHIPRSRLSQSQSRIQPSRNELPPRAFSRKSKSRRGDTPTPSKVSTRDTNFRRRGDTPSGRRLLSASGDWDEVNSHHSRASSRKRDAPSSIDGRSVDSRTLASSAEWDERREPGGRRYTRSMREA